MGSVKNARQQSFAPRCKVCHPIIRQKMGEGECEPNNERTKPELPAPSKYAVQIPTKVKFSRRRLMDRTAGVGLTCN